MCSRACEHNVLYQLDREYVVKDGQVIIVDEFTGRLMPGRRWSDGLHQLWKPRGVKIERENQTLATITFQNYFRMFKKLAGMTGTAETEAAEFGKTYKLDVIVIPTHMRWFASTTPTLSTELKTKNFAMPPRKSRSVPTWASPCSSALSRSRNPSASRHLKKMGVSTRSSRQESRA